MKRPIKLSVCALCLSLIGMWLVEDTLAQRGRGGGGGGRGGVSRGGGGRSGASRGGGSRPSAGRSPSMSRPSGGRSSGGNRQSAGNRPSGGNRSAAGQRPSPGGGNRAGTGNRPGAGNRPGTGNRPQAGDRPGGGNRPGAGDRSPGGQRPSQGQLNDFINPGERSGGGGAAGDFLRDRSNAGQQGLRDRPGAGSPGGERPPGAGDRPGRPGMGNRPGRIPEASRPVYRDRRVARGTGIRRTFRTYPVRLPRFGASFWGRHPNWRWRWASHNRNWWRWASWGGVAGWVAFTWDQPRDYNWGENVYFQDDSVYLDDQVIATVDEFVQEAYELAQDVPDVTPEEVDWLPLGVFALCADDGEETGPDPTIFLQLAISREAIIAGTLQNTATDNAFEVEGTIDEESQRVAWGRIGEGWPIMETGIANLTDDEAPALLHFDDGQTQQWLLVRLEEPDETGEGEPDERDEQEKQDKLDESDDADSEANAP